MKKINLLAVLSLCAFMTIDAKTTLNMINNSSYPVTIDIKATHKSNTKTRHETKSFSINANNKDSWTYQGGLENVDVTNKNDTTKKASKHLGNAKNHNQSTNLTITDDVNSPGTPVIAIS